MIKIFLTVALVVVSIHANTQTLTMKASAFYPIPKEFKLKDDGNDFDNIISRECVAGNCKKGVGTYVEVLQYTIWLNAAAKPFVDVKIRTGTFSEDGKYFEGHTYKVYVEYTHTKTKNDGVLTPVNAFDLTDLSKLQPFHDGKGTMMREINCKQSCSYEWAGWRRNTITTPEPGAPSAYSKYYEYSGAIIGQKLEYAPGGVYKEFTGRSIYYDEIVGGRFAYSDNSVYEGFVFRGKFFGPGILTSASGEKKQGIWMMDTLAMPMEIKLPDAVFDPALEADKNLPDYEPRQTSVRWSSPLHNYYQGPDTWVLGTNAEKIYCGKTEGKSFEGPGILIEFEKQDRIYTYWTGIFSDGVLTKGMRVTYNVMNVDRYTSIVSGEFANGKLVAGCNREVTLDSFGKPYLILEGMFYPSANWDGEVRSGWMYVNDWAGLRQEKNLRYFYSNRNVLGEGFTPEWWISAAEEAVDAPYCFPKIITQRDAILKKLLHKGDSMLAQKKAREADRERLAQKRREAQAQTAACMAKINKNGIDLGVTVTDGQFVGYVSDVDCDKETLTIVNPGSKLVYGGSPEKRTVQMYDFTTWRRHKLQYRTCSRCNGTCGETQTSTTSKTKELPFGYFSGITTTVTKTTTQTYWAHCPKVSRHWIVTRVA